MVTKLCLRDDYGALDYEESYIWQGLHARNLHGLIIQSGAAS